MGRRTSSREHGADRENGDGGSSGREAAGSMTDDRHDTPPPRPPLDLRTLAIASLASVVGALVVTRLGYAGKIAGAALAPIVVLLVTEFGHRSSARVEETVEKVAPVVISRRRSSNREGTEELPTIVLPPPEPGAHIAPSGPPASRLYTVHSSEARSRRTTGMRLAGVLLAAACGLVASIGGFTLLSAASGGHVKVGTALQSSTGHHARGKKKSSKTTPPPTGSSSVESPTSSTRDTATSTATDTAPATTSSSAPAPATSTAPTGSTPPGSTAVSTSVPVPATTAVGPAGTAPGPGPATTVTPTPTPTTTGGP